MAIDLSAFEFNTKALDGRLLDSKEEISTSARFKVELPTDFMKRLWSPKSKEVHWTWNNRIQSVV